MNSCGVNPVNLAKEVRMRKTNNFELMPLFPELRGISAKEQIIYSTIDNKIQTHLKGQKRLWISWDQAPDFSTTWDSTPMTILERFVQKTYSRLP